MKAAVAKSAAVALFLSAAGLGLIKVHEGTIPQVYKDPVGILTVCTGHVSPGLKLGDRFTAAQCEQLLRQDTAAAQSTIKRVVKVPVTQEQYDALTSLVFNIGGTAFTKSTLLKRINEGSCQKAAKEFNRWVYAQGVKLPGLIKRREQESKMYASGC